MKVYTVLYNSDEYSYLGGIFASMKEANDYIEKSNDNENLFTTEEWNVATGKEIAKEVRVGTSFNVNRYEYDEYMLCPSCSSEGDVGNFLDGELYFNYCPMCGQKLKFTEDLYE